ncbi:MAG: hypothetical protein AABW50_02035 [Nanoarchaeota archaeon]
MDNVFFEIEDRLFFDEEIIFDEAKIKQFIFDFLLNDINSRDDKKRGFYFEEIVYNFFEYLNVPLVKTKKTRDFGIDGIIKLKLNLLGEINLGLQVKYKIIDSTDVDLFLSSLRNSELQLGAIVCRDSRKLEKYGLNSKLRAILLSKGIKVREKLIKDDINLNPVFILKFDELVEIVASQIRGVIKSIYKK